VLLLITSSLDFTGNAICKNLKKDVFRFNYDIFNEYSFEFTADSWKITNPVGHTISSASISSCFWWKAFQFEMENQDSFVVAEVKYIFRELYAWCKLRGIVKGNPYDFHNHLGKINLLEIASKYFPTPKTLATFKLEGLNNIKAFPIVAKSLSSALTDKRASLLATKVDHSKLSPDFPWFLQEVIESDFDVTIFVCGKSLFAFERSRKNLKGLDWRGEQTSNPNVKEWLPLILNPKEIKSIESFCKDIEVDWGRLDLMKKNNELVFLEFNANGQWLFLDFKEEYGILKKVLNYLYP